MTRNGQHFVPHPMFETRKRRFDGLVVKYRYSPSRDRVMQWEIVSVKEG